ncbi:MAG: TolC family protein [Pseudomonadota bacterium]
MFLNRAALSSPGFVAGISGGSARVPAAFLVLFLVSPGAGAEPKPEPEKKKPSIEKPSGVKVLNLEDCLKMSRKNHPAIMAARHKLVSLKKQLSEAHWAPYFNIGMTTMLAPMSRSEGNAIYSPQGEFDISTDMGIWVSLKIDAGLPLYTFGKITSYWKMAEEGVNIGAMEVKKQINEIEYAVRRAYYTVLFSRHVHSILDEGKGWLEEAQDKIEKDLDEELGEATLSDLLKVKAYKAQLESNIIQVENAEQTAMAGLRFLTGIKDIEISGKTIQSEEGDLKTVTWYLDEARKNRPEFFILDSAVNVSKTQHKLSKLHYLPDLLLVGSYTYAYANKVDDQDTPFAYDPYNRNGGGVALMLRYPFDFVPNYFRTDKVKAQLLQMQAQQQAATGMFLMEVETAYNEAYSLYKRVKVLKKRKKGCKRMDCRHQPELPGRPGRLQGFHGCPGHLFHAGF